MVKRHVPVRVQAWDRHGNPIDEVVHGLKAGTYQHEVDHLDGKIFVDRADPTHVHDVDRVRAPPQGRVRREGRRSWSRASAPDYFAVKVLVIKAALKTRVRLSYRRFRSWSQYGGAPRRRRHHPDHRTPDNFHHRWCISLLPAWGEQPRQCRHYQRSSIHTGEPRRPRRSVAHPLLRRRNRRLHHRLQRRRPWHP